MLLSVNQLTSELAFTKRKTPSSLVRRCCSLCNGSARDVSPFSWRLEPATHSELCPLGIARPVIWLSSEPAIRNAPTP